MKLCDLINKDKLLNPNACDYIENNFDTINHNLSYCSKFC